MYHQLRERLVELRCLDNSCKVFGAKHHCYQSVPAVPNQIERFEHELGASLPSEYRQFLLEIGCGAGPYYGVWSPTQSLMELQELSQEILCEMGTHVSPSAHFPLKGKDLRRIEDKITCNDEAPWAELDWPSSGCLPIGHQGCTFWSVLVIQGEFAGRIWDVANFVGYLGQWLPARRPPGWWEFGMPHPKELPPLPSPPTFLEWFSGWVERCFSDLRGKP